MAQIEGGGPAFPAKSVPTTDIYGNDVTSGMSLRDWFAGQALPAAWDGYDKGYYQSAGDSASLDIAKCAYQLADAMLKAREGRAP